MFAEIGIVEHVGKGIAFMDLLLSRILNLY